MALRSQLRGKQAGQQSSDQQRFRINKRSRNRRPEPLLQFILLSWAAGCSRFVLSVAIIPGNSIRCQHIANSGTLSDAIQTASMRGLAASSQTGRIRGERIRDLVRGSWVYYRCQDIMSTAHHRLQLGEFSPHCNRAPYNSSRLSIAVVEGRPTEPNGTCG